MARFPTRPWPIRNLQILHQTVPPESETTRLTIKLAAPQAAPLHADDPQLAMAFAERGMDLRETREVEDGLWLGFGELSIVLTTPPERPDEIRIIGTGEDDGAPRSPQARARFRACATLARFIAVRNRVRRIEWRHRGGHYITENGHIAVVSGMDGTTGRGPRRSAAARAFSLYGPASVDDDTARRSRQPDFRIGGSASRSLPEKLSEAAANTTVCVLSPPTGAALITYSLLRGGSFEQSARWVAMTGLAVGLTSPQLMLALLN